MNKLLLLLLGLALFSCAGKGKSFNLNDKGQRVVKIAVNISEISPNAASLREVMTLFNKKVGDAYEFQYFYDAQLGEQKQVIELIRSGGGGIDLGWVNSSILGTYVSLFDVFNLPYVLNGNDHAVKVTTSAEVNKLLIDASILQKFVPIILFDAGTGRSFMGRKPYLKPDDLKGEKIRIQQSAIYVKIIEALGGSPVPLPNNEIYTSLQQGIIDGNESVPSILTQIGDVVKHFSYTETTRPTDILVSSQAFWDSISEEHKVAFIEARNNVLANFHIDNFSKEQEKAIIKAMEVGVQFHKNVDLNAFKTALQPMKTEWSELKEEHKKLLDLIASLE